ncbi:MAG: LysM peptidoglycan-binding domain-containing protein [Myxococcaceae bacterium]|nr:LysM peptidoglycan-binding domain-containing protein [Myxococcaceae bacterium]
MQTHTIARGDTLWALSRRFGTTVDALVKANNIANPDMIYAGAQLRIPGRGDSFETGGRPTPIPSPDNTIPPTPGGRNRAFEIAMSHLGKNAGDLKLEGGAVGRAMEDWVPNNVNCASFVSACLEAAGQIDHSDYSARVVDLQANLDNNDKFKRVSLENAKPGDVVSFKTPGGHHVVMFAGWKDGKPQFVGSNNVNSDGTQRITVSPMNYQLLSVHQYVG